MTLQLGALREALINAGASEDMATKAAEEAAGYEPRLAGIETRMGGIDQRMTAIEARMTTMEANMIVLGGRMGALESRMTMMMWMMGLLTTVTSINLALTGGMLWHVLSH